MMEKLIFNLIFLTSPVIIVSDGSLREASGTTAKVWEYDLKSESSRELPQS